MFPAGYYVKPVQRYLWDAMLTPSVDMILSNPTDSITHVRTRLLISISAPGFGRTISCLIMFGGLVAPDLRRMS